jgi:hypothetical protein
MSGRPPRAAEIVDAMTRKDQDYRTTSHEFSPLRKDGLRNGSLPHGRYPEMTPV